MTTRRFPVSRLASLHLLVALLAGALAPAAWADTCKIPSTPDNARVEMIAPEMVNNSVAMSVRSIESALPVEGLLAYYRQLWAPLATKTRPGSREDEADGWKVISTVIERCFVTVQVKSRSGGSYALLTVSRPPEPALKDKLASLVLPMLPGSSVLSDMGYAEPVRNARTLVIVNSARVATNVEFYATELPARGWTLLMKQKVKGTSGPADVVALRRGLEELNLVIAPAADGRTTVVANLVDRP